MSKKTIIALLWAGFYLDILLAANALIHLPTPKLPRFLYPVEPIQYQEPNPYEHDCWGVEDNYCWYEEYDI